MLTNADDAGTYSSGDYYPVQFCLQSDDSFIVVNRLGTEDTADDANIVQMCQETNGQGDQINVLHLFTPANAVSSTCNTITLRLARPQGYSIPTSPTTTSVSTTASPSASVSACVPVPDGQEFRLSLVGTSDYLTGATGGLTPIGNEGQQLAITQDYSQAIPFLSAPGRDGQITLVSSDGTTLYSDQDITGSGNGPVYFDTLDAIENSAFNPVQFCLQSDNTFVVQNLGNDKADAADDANILQLCPDQEVGQVTLYLHTPAVAASSGCDTVRLEIAGPPYVPPVGCPSTSVQIPDNHWFRIKSSTSNLYLSGLYGGGNPTSGDIKTAPDVADAIIFTVNPDGTGQLRIVGGGQAIDSLILSMSATSGYLYFFPNRSAAAGWYPVLFCAQPGNTFAVRTNSPSIDVNTAVICPSNNNEKVYFDNGSGTAAFAGIGCFAETLVYEIVP